MNAKRIIPCLDVKDGRVVKGINFLELKDAGDPVEQARFYDEAGADEIVFLDITASHEGRQTMVDVVRRTAAAIMTPITVGGGVVSVDDARALLENGADKVGINTAAVAGSKSERRDSRSTSPTVIMQGAHSRPGTRSRPSLVDSSSGAGNTSAGTANASRAAFMTYE